MENLKIRVNNEAESKEVQQLFFELGYNWFKKGYVEVKTPETIMSFENGALSTGIRGSINHKEITIPHLRDMVVLKRNDRNDRTHTDQDGWSWFISSNGTGYVFGAGNANGLHQWDESSLNMVDLKPIEKPMKEYLRKNSNGTYSYIGTVRPEHVSDFMIEIPEGATKLVSHGYVHLPIMFVKPCANGYSYCYPKENWSDNILSNIKGRDILWSRHTHPEELPFIDDDFKLNIPEELKGRADLLSGRIIVDDEPSFESHVKMMKSLTTKCTPKPSLNDQYAEIEKVRQTLNQRQSQYGSFEDVAQTTEQLFQVIKGGASFVDFTESQRMALYMIFSKVARLSNGDCNHKDSWHDIAGYATLIDEVL